MLKRTTDAAGIARFSHVNAVPGSNDWSVQAFYKNDPMPTEYARVVTQHGYLYEFGASASYWPDPNDCRTAGSRGRCGKFSVTRAVSYARTYADTGEYNPDYPEIDGTDCTNFLNQILRAGGVTYSGEYERREDAADDHPGNQSRWYKYGSNNSRCWENGNCTISWIRVQAIVDHLRGRNLVTRIKTGNNKTRISNARPGDIVFFNWSEGNGMDHAMFVTSTNQSGAPNVTGHTSDRKDLPWSILVRNANEQAEGDTIYKADWTFDIYRLKGPARFND